MSADAKPFLLVIPPSPFLLDERVFVSLGILKVAAALERAGHEVEVLDLSGVEAYAEVAARRIAMSRAEVVGITVTSPQLPSVARIVPAIRAARPDVRIVLGGPHVTLVNAARRSARTARAEAAMSTLLALSDTLVAGDGERAILEAAMPGAPPLVDADDRASAHYLQRHELDEQPWPARHLVDLDSYRYEIDGVRATSLIAQLGCPFPCGFCGGRSSASFRRIRTRSPSRVLDELRHLRDRHGYRGFMFYDDELNLHPGTVELMRSIAEEQARRGESWRLRGFVKSELFTDEHARAMHDAGFRWILVGFESGDDRMLSNMRKRATSEQNRRCVDIAHRHGLKVKALMSLGHPGESGATIAATRRWLLDVAPDDLDVTLITPYPGSPYYDQAEAHPTRPGVFVYTARETGDRLYAHDIDYASCAGYYKGDPDDGYTSFVFTDHSSATDLVEARDALDREVRAHFRIPEPRAVAREIEQSMGQSRHRVRGPSEAPVPAAR